MACLSLGILTFNLLVTSLKYSLDTSVSRWGVHKRLFPVRFRATNRVLSVL